jgi:hypothetical protein
VTHSGDTTSQYPVGQNPGHCDWLRVLRLDRREGLEWLTLLINGVAAGLQNTG